MPRTSAAYYLAAMIDGEGCVNAGKFRTVEICNTDEDIVEATEEALDILGIHHKRYVAKRRSHARKDLFRVVVCGRDNLQKVYELVPIMSIAKREKLAYALSQYRDMPSDNEIAAAYAIGSSREVAEKFGCSNSYVLRRMRDLGLVRDKRDAAVLRRDREATD